VEWILGALRPFGRLLGRVVGWAVVSVVGVGFVIGSGYLLVWGLAFGEWLLASTYHVIRDWGASSALAVAGTVASAVASCSR